MVNRLKWGVCRIGSFDLRRYGTFDGRLITRKTCHFKKRRTKVKWFDQPAFVRAVCVGKLRNSVPNVDDDDGQTVASSSYELNGFNITKPIKLKLNSKIHYDKYEISKI